ncbi:MAG: hypothetical protein M3Z22_08615 [Verrucomicrobiota bacterium]|nr:hypothetical protein [Verrucomicrobiota bacterium]
MKWLSGGLTLVNVASVCAVFFGMAGGGLGRGIAGFSIIVGAAAAVIAWGGTRDVQLAATSPELSPTPTRFDLARLIFWMLAGCFGFFAFRSFCWLLYIDGNELKIQSINNLGDLSLHLTYIRNFASGVALWPDNPIYAFSKLRYPAGTDLFNALLLLIGVDLIRGLVWAGLIGSVATFYALYRWGRNFGVAGFLFNGGLVGFEFLRSFKFLDYQGDKTIAWKSLALSMFVTQRGLLYAIPAGLILLCHWRTKYFREEENSGRGFLPLWVEISLYASMPLFHIHTFMALSIVAAFIFLFGDMRVRKSLALLVGISVVPATFFVWSITDHFQARSLMKLHAGWVQTNDDFAAPFFRFWLVNFGMFLPLVIALAALCAFRSFNAETRAEIRARSAYTFLTAAAFLFFFACLVKTAPWEWDNIKIIIWAYLIVLPVLWSELISQFALPLRALTCIALFFSGFVSLVGGSLANTNGYGIAERAEVDAVGTVVRKLPAEARFAAFPTYNHPLLLQGRKLVVGYPGHLWTQGFFDYGTAAEALERLMNGDANWRDEAQHLHARYLFWGREEKAHYTTSARPWETASSLIASGNWGAIYDLENPAPPAKASQ